MHARALTLADTLARTAPPAPTKPKRPRRPRRCCAGWPTGTSRSSATASTTWSTGRTGCAARGARHRPRHPAARPAGVAARSPRCRPRCGPGPRDPRLLILTKANSRVHRAPAALPGLHRGQAVRRRTARWPASTGSSGCTRTSAYSESITRIPVLRRKLAGVLAASRPGPGQPRRQGPGRVPGGLPARGAVPDLGAGADPDRADGVLRLRDRKQTRLFLRKDPYGRYMSCLVYLPRDRYTTAVRLRAQEILREALGGASVELQRHGRRVGAGPAARRGAGEPRQAAARRGRRPPWNGSWSRPSGPGTTTWPRRPAGRWARPRARCAARRCATTRSRTPTRPTCPPRPRPSDLARIAALRESGEDTCVRAVGGRGVRGRRAGRQSSQTRASRPPGPRPASSTRRGCGG